MRLSKGCVKGSSMLVTDISKLTISCAMAPSTGLPRAPARQNAFCPRCAYKPLAAPKACLTSIRCKDAPESATASLPVHTHPDRIQVIALD